VTLGLKPVAAEDAPVPPVTDVNAVAQSPSETIPAVTETQTETQSVVTETPVSVSDVAVTQTDSASVLQETGYTQPVDVPVTSSETETPSSPSAAPLVEGGNAIPSSPLAEQAASTGGSDSVIGEANTSTSSEVR
jgi:hypothetical protein